MALPSHDGALTPQQLSLVEQLKREVAGLVEAHAHLQLFCNDHTYVRYLRARQWHLPKAIKMLMDTLHWRLEYKPHLIRWDDVKMEAREGKHFLYPAKDNQGRPIVMMRPRLESTKTYDTQIKFLIYDLEQASKIADKTGVGKMVWLLDFEGYTLSNAPPIKISVHCNHILQNHYPERLGLAVCYHAPTLFTFTWKATRPFIDPLTQKKIIFISKGSKEAAEMKSMFNMDEMEECIGGKRKGLVYNMNEYQKVCEQFDAETSAELEAAEASAKVGRQGAAAGNGAGAGTGAGMGAGAAALGQQHAHAQQPGDYGAFDGRASASSLMKQRPPSWWERQKSSFRMLSRGEGSFRASKAPLPEGSFRASKAPEEQVAARVV